MNNHSIFTQIIVVNQLKNEKRMPKTNKFKLLYLNILKNNIAEIRIKNMIFRHRNGSDSI